MNFEMINATYYNTDDLVRILEFALDPNRRRFTNIRVQYINKPLPYHENSSTRSYGTRRPHRWSQEAQGWGHILNEGDCSMAHVSSPSGRHADYRSLVLSIVRKQHMYGSNPLEVLASEGEEVPEVAVKHIVFAVLSFLDRWSTFDTLWPSAPKQLRIGRAVEKAGQIRNELKKADQRHQIAQAELLDAQQRLRKYEESVVLMTGVVAERRVKVEAIEALIADMQRKLGEEDA